MDSARHTLVMEFTCREPVGTDRAGAEKVERYLLEVADLMGQSPLREPLAHLSPKYGLSGWLPLRQSSAIHFYAWDDRRPSFVSVDVSTRQRLDPARFVEHADAFFNLAGEEVAVKSTDDAMECRWRELDGSICRQRLAIRGTLVRPLRDREAATYLLALCDALRMAGLSEPVVAGRTAWMHWETSGVLMDWEENIEIDIYTCKPFNPADAAELTERLLPAVGLALRGF